MIIESVLTSKGQTTLPKAVREALGVGPGDRVRYVLLPAEVRISRVRPIGRLFGALKYEGPTVDLSDMERAIEDGGRET